jgi:hypothetical protein
MRKVLIATPSYDGKVSVYYANALAETIRLGLSEDIYFHAVYMSFDALVQRARNDLVAVALEADFDDILWIDSDMEWSAEWAVKFVKSELDVLGAPCAKKSLAEQYNVKCNPEDLIPDENGIIKAQAIGTGFLKMSKAALQSLWDSSESYTFNEQERRWIFDVEIQDGDLVSEDILVCKKLVAAGFDINVDSTITCGHVGSMYYSGNFADFVVRIAESLKEIKE